MKKKLFLFLTAFMVGSLHAEGVTTPTQQVSDINWYVGNTAPGEWIEYKKVWLSAGHYRFTAKVKADKTEQTVHLEVNNQNLIDGVQVPVTDNFSNVHLGSIQLAEGYYDLKLVFETGNVNCDNIFIRKNASSSTAVTADDTKFVWSSLSDGMMIAPIGCHSYETPGFIHIANELGNNKDKNGNSYTNEQLLDWYSVQNHVYTPSHTDAAMDQWVEELVAAKPDFVFMHGRSQADFVNELEDRDYRFGNGALGGRLLKRFVEAVNRSPYAKGNIKLAYFQDNASYASAYKGFTGNEMNEWNDPDFMQVTWEHWFKPWYETVPENMLYKTAEGKIPIQLWTANVGDPSGQKHILEFLQYIEQQLNASFGYSVEWIVPDNFFSKDSRVRDYAAGQQAWFVWGGSTTSMVEHKGVKYAFGVNGKRLPFSNCYLNDYDPITGTGTKVSETDHFTPPMKADGTLLVRDMMEAGNRENARWMVLESFSDVAEGTVYFRTDKPLFAYPNQSIATIREFADRKTESIMLEAEACDFFFDRSKGNSGGDFRYHWHTDGEPDLDIYRPLHRIMDKRNVGTPGAAIAQLSVGQQDVWAISTSGSIIAEEVDGIGANWRSINNNKNVKDIAVGHRYTWCITADNKVYYTRLPQGWDYFNCTGWVDVTSEKSIKDLDIALTKVWGIDNDGNVYYRDLDGLKDWVPKQGKLNSIVADETYICGFAPNGKIAISRANDSNVWDTIPNPYNVVKIDAGAGELWGLTADGKIYRTSCSGSSEWQLIDQNFACVSVGNDRAWGVGADGNTYVWKLYGFEDQIEYNTHLLQNVANADQEAYGGTPWAIPGTIEFENYDEGGEGVAYHDNDSNNAWGQYRPAEGVDINRFGEGLYNIGNAANGEWVEYTVNILETALYDVSFVVSADGDGRAFHLEMDDNNISGTITLTGTNGWGNYITINKINLPLEKGLHTLKIYIERAPLNLDKMIFTKSARQPYNGVPQTIPGIIEMENFDIGENGETYYDNTSGNAWNKYRTDVDVDINEFSSKQYNIGNIAAGEWLEFTVDIKETDNYYLDYRVCSYGNASFYLEIDGANITGNVNIIGKNDWSTWQTVRQQNIALTAGIHILRFVPNTSMNIDKIAFSNTEVAAESITLSRTTLSVPVYETKQITCQLLPINASFNAVVWSSENENIATVDQNGNITGVAPGYVRIYAKTEDESLSASCDVLVTLGHPLRIVPIGNSITQSNNEHNSYRYNFWKKMIDADMPFDFVGTMNTNYNGNPNYVDYKNRTFDTDNEGHWGIQTPTFKENINNWASNYTADIALIHLGTNDIGNRTPEESKTNLAYIINALRAKNPNVVIFVAKLIPRQNKNHTDYNNMIETLATEMNTEESPVILVDQATGFDWQTDTWDGTHPNAIGEEKIAQRWFDALQSYLNSLPNEQKPYGSEPLKIPGVIEIEYFDKGGEGVAYHDTTTGNAWNQYRKSEDVDLNRIGEGLYAIGNTANGEWLEYTVNIEENGNYTFKVRSSGYGGKIHLELDEENVSNTLRMTNWGDYNIYDWTSYENIPLIKGTHVLKFYIENSGFNCDKMEFVFESFSTDVNENTISQLIVYAQGKNIIVENASEEITITDALGRVIDRDDVHAVCTGIRTFAVPASGVYIVKVGDKSYMILVK
ncbi:MAG: DUF5010 domain-containing protein [Paludibacteraceae bacterium]|nr:DUF5010 domain-containing protein [Paludibacteraceae bacterium]